MLFVEPIAPPGPERDVQVAVKHCCWCAFNRCACGTAVSLCDIHRAYLYRGTK